MPNYVPILVTRLPTLLVQVAALVVCIVFWRRAPRGAMFATLGIVLLILAVLVSMGSTIWIMQNRGTASAAVSQVMAIFAVAGMLLNAGGIALLVTGVFAGRETPEPSGFEVQPIESTRFNAPPPPGPPPPPLLR